MQTAPKSAQWLFQEGARIHGQWEPLYFERMRGRAGENQKMIYDFCRSRAFMEHLARQGVNQVWFNWWKGFGLKHEKECQDQVARLFPVCRDLGIKSVCYHTFGSLTLDTLLLEEPDAVNWVTRTQAGQPSTCQVTFQCFRNRPCFSSEGYLGYMEKVLARAIDAGADGIHFDNIGNQSEPEACHCPRCTRLFREYLQERFGGDLGEEIFGMRDFSRATVPWFNQHNPSARFWRALPPHHWSWIDFKAHTLGGASRRLTNFIHKRNPQCYVESNAYEGDGFGSMFWRGIDYDAMFPSLELISDEASPGLKVNAKGAMVGAFRAKKYCRAFGCGHWGHENVLDFCEESVISSAPLGFWKKYKDYQLKTASRARVAVLRERHSLAYNRFDPYEETLAIEQYPIERHIAFDFVHNGNLGQSAGAYDLLIVAGAEVMPDAVRDEIVNYVRAGGALLLTGACGVYDRYYRVRQQPVKQVTTMEEFAQAKKPRNAFHELVGCDPLGSCESIIQRQIGPGRVAWMRAMDIERLPRNESTWILGENWFAMPGNAADIDGVMSFLMPRGFGLRVETQAKIYVHLAGRQDTGELLIHLIHLEYPAKTAQAEVRLRVAGKPHEVFSISQDDVDNDYAPRPHVFRMEADEVVAAVDNIRSHCTIIVRP